MDITTQQYQVIRKECDLRPHIGSSPEMHRRYMEKMMREGRQVCAGNIKLAQVIALLNLRMVN